MPDPLSASPTGAPVIPAKVVPWLVGLVAAAAAAAVALPDHTVADQVASAIVWLGSILGLASPGWRRKP